MDTSSISSELTMDYQAQLDMMDQDVQQTIVVQQDTTINNNNVQQAQLDAFAMSTIQPYNS